jgi:hypothetical protein
MTARRNRSWRSEMPTHLGDRRADQLGRREPGPLRLVGEDLLLDPQPGDAVLVLVYSEEEGVLGGDARVEGRRRDPSPLAHRGDGEPLVAAVLT